MLNSEGSEPLDAELLAQEATQLRAAVDSQRVVGQASGMLMAWFDLDANQAFEHLRQRSMHENRKLIDIADEIVRKRHRPTRLFPIARRDR